jgi:hypothetical protein
MWNKTICNKFDRVQVFGVSYILEIHILKNPMQEIAMNGII